MSMILMIDGYNVAQPIRPGRSPDPRWLENTRKRLLHSLAEHLPAPIRAKTCVVFDANNPPRDRSDTAEHHSMLIRYAVGYNSADDLLAEMIRQHHSPKRLMVVSSDHRVQMAASRRSARFYDSEPWMDDLTDGKLHLAIDIQNGAGQGGQANRTGSRRNASGKLPMGGEPPKPRVQSEDEVSDWMREFGFDDE